MITLPLTTAAAPAGSGWAAGVDGAAELLYASGSYVPGGGGSSAPNPGTLTLTEVADVLFLVRMTFPSAVASNYVMSVNVSGGPTAAGGGVLSGALVNLSGAQSGHVITRDMQPGTYTVAFGFWTQVAQTAQFAWSVTCVRLRRTTGLATDAVQPSPSSSSGRSRFGRKSSRSALT